MEASAIRIVAKRAQALEKVKRASQLIEFDSVPRETVRVYPTTTMTDRMRLSLEKLASIVLFEGLGSFSQAGIVWLIRVQWLKSVFCSIAPRTPYRRKG